MKLIKKHRVCSKRRSAADLVTEDERGENWEIVGCLWFRCLLISAGGLICDVLKRWRHLRGRAEVRDPPPPAPSDHLQIKRDGDK